MSTIADVCRYLERFAPPELAADWDNTGLLLGDPASSATKIITCLTITAAVVDEAIAERADMIVTHHPILFRGTKQIVADRGEGKLLWPLARAGIAVYSPHTSFDNTRDGINDSIAQGLGLKNVTPLRPRETGEFMGEGRLGTLPARLRVSELVALVKQALGARVVQVVGPLDRNVERIAIACGAAGEFLGDAVKADADLFLTGEMRFHDYLAAVAQGIALILPGHYATERPAVEELAKRLQTEFADINVWSSRRETDPVAWV